jgi:hypothetical protein
MNKRRISFYPTIVLIIISLFNPGIKAENTQTFETVSIRTRADLGDLPATNPINPQPFADRSVIFNLSDSGKHTPILWGLATAGPSRDNILRGGAVMGSENIYLVRASFQPTLPLLDGDLQSQQVIDLNNRLNLINLTGSHTKVALNCDHPALIPGMPAMPKLGTTDGRYHPSCTGGRTSGSINCPF